MSEEKGGENRKVAWERELRDLNAVSQLYALVVEGFKCYIQALLLPSN